MVSDSASSFVETVIVLKAGAYPEGGQWVQWGGLECGFAIGLPRIEYTVQVGDRITFYWPSNHPGTALTPLGLSINDGPMARYE